MKILHTSDWHLGAVFDSQKRYEEFDKVLEFLLKVIREEHIEAVIIAGDVFDSNLPSNRATEQYYDFLVASRDAGVKNVIVTAGNHDSASFLEKLTLKKLIHPSFRFRQKMGKQPLLSALFRICATAISAGRYQEKILTRRRTAVSKVCLPGMKKSAPDLKNFIPAFP